MLRYLLLPLLLLLLAPAGAGERNHSHDRSEASLQPRSLFFTLDNVRKPFGTIWVGVYQSEDDFLDREKARLIAVKVDMAGRATIEIPELLPGEDYALGVFHDVNDNGEFDTNFLGLPAEPWAFSGKLKSKLRLPRFNEVSFVFDTQAPMQMLRLRTWF